MASTMTAAEAEAYIDGLRSNPLYVGALIAVSNARTGTVTESGLARKAVTLGTSTTLGNGDVQAANTSDVLFDVASSNQGDIVGLGLYSALTGGTLKHVKALGTAKPIYVSDQLKITAGSLTVTA